MSSREYRSLTEENLDDLVEVIDRSRAYTPFHRRPTRDEVRVEFLGDPDYDPDGAWLVYDDGSVVGLGYVVVEKGRIAAGLNDGYLDVDVVPERRGAGIEQELLARCIARLVSKGVGKARTRCFVGDEWRRALLASDSFKVAYHVYTLVRKGGQGVEDTAIPDGYAIERRVGSECSDADIVAITDSLNDSFQDHFAFGPESPERFMNFRDASGHEMMFSLAMCRGVIAGFCLADVDPALNARIGVKSGWIDILGVNMAHRRHGLGRAMLVDGIRWILDQGMDTVYIQVFAKNDQALGLYRSYGFENDEESLWLHRDVMGRHGSP